MHAEFGIEPLPHWEKSRATPKWTKNIYRNFSKTILKPLLKLKPNRRKVNWRDFGRIIGILARFQTFFRHDIPAILKAEGLDKISDARWARMQPLLGEKMAHAYCLKVLKLPADSIVSDEGLNYISWHKQIVLIERMNWNALSLVSLQDAKVNELFFQGMREGYAAVLNSDGEFSADDRRAGIHFELLGCQSDIEKMRRTVPQKHNKHLIDDLKRLSEFKNRSDDWFNDVFKDIKLSIGKRGRPPAYCQA